MKHVIGRPINISIAGFGNVGSTVAEVLLHDRFSQHYHYNINIMEPGYETTQHGKVLDFLQASVIHHRHHTISLNDEEIYLDSDYIVHCAGVTGSSIKSDRMELLDSSKVTTEMLFKNKKFSKRNLRIIALSNPLDIIAYYTREYSNLTPQNVVATGTYLDAMRLQYYITKELNIPEKYNVSCMVLGEHGTDMVPLFSNVYIKDNETDSIVEKLEFTQEQKDKLNYQTVNAAKEIKATQGCTYFGVATCCVSLLHMFMEASMPFNIPGNIVNMQPIPLCVQITPHFKELLGIKKDIFLSLPVNIKHDNEPNADTCHIYPDIARSKYEVLDSTKMSPEEIRLLSKAAKKLEQVICC